MGRWFFLPALASSLLVDSPPAVVCLFFTTGKLLPVSKLQGRERFSGKKSISRIKESLLILCAYIATTFVLFLQCTRCMLCRVNVH